jgi:uncharacterized protein involved in response to NO
MNPALLDNPYRVFFPLAWLMGLWGGFVWVLFAFGIGDLPALIHPQAMMAGFLLGHVMGFLLTAGPRFTGTGVLTSVELSPAVATYLALCMTVVFQQPLKLPQEVTFGLFAMSIVVMAAILGFRLLRRTKSPPAEFVFLPFGLFAALIGALIKVSGETSAFVSQLGNLFIYEAFILSLVLGIGSRLGPFLMGHGQAPDAAPSPADTKARTNRMRSLLLPLIVFWFSYFLEAHYQPVAPIHFARVLRGIVLLYVFGVHWKIFEGPKNATRQAWGVWASAWMVMLGLFSSSIATWRVHSLHLFYIGGLGLLTLMVATRVTLAHGSKRLLLEKTSASLYPVIALLLLAAWVRLAAIFVPEFYVQTLAVAASLWVVGLFIWGVVFIKEGSGQSLGSADD